VFDLINGLPWHPLVVHAVVVLLPLAAFGTIALALRPAWRHHYGPVVVAAGVLGVILCPVATSSGEALQSRVGSPGEHAELGDQLVWFAIPLVLLSAALVYLDRRRVIASDGPGASTATATRTTTSPTTLRVVAVLAVIAALALTVQVVRVGDSGARAAWGDRVASGSSHSSDGD
jgi:hypothetical protein